MIEAMDRFNQLIEDLSRRMSRYSFMQNVGYPLKTVCVLMYSESIMTPNPEPEGTLITPLILSNGSALLSTGTTVPLASLV